MIGISQTLFQVERDYQLEFVHESNGQYQSIIMSWSDGYSEKIDRTH
ncbi:hypothetical protein [Chryseobacterium lactis]|nr:hypothetical protein [Chryseobacterium lactis]